MCQHLVLEDHEYRQQMRSRYQCSFSSTTMSRFGSFHSRPHALHYDLYHYTYQSLSNSELGRIPCFYRMKQPVYGSCRSIAKEHVPTIEAWRYLSDDHGNDRQEKNMSCPRCMTRKMALYAQNPNPRQVRKPVIYLLYIDQWY